jgi:HAD superfamily hydrolase (TIGR01509 family)
MIKLIIFDLSDVCFTAEEPPYLKEFAERHSLNYEEFEKYYVDLLIKAEVDEISGEGVWDRIFSHFHIEDETFEKVMKEMMVIKKPVVPTLELVKQLRGKYKTAYLTNYNKDYWKYVAKMFDLNPYFDFGLASYQIKARKPAPEGFKAILDHFGYKPKEAIFTDDSIKNLSEAKKMGIHTIQFEHADQFANVLKDFGIKIE